MKKITFCFSALFLFSLICTAAQSDDKSASQDIIIYLQPTGTGPRPRSVQIEPMTCSYSLGTVQVHFLQNIGQSTITIVNNSTGEQWFEIADSADGVVAISISDTPGDYTIYIELESGKTYSGSFTLF